MEYLAIKQKKIAKPKKPVNIIFDNLSSQENVIDNIQRVEIIDKTKSSGINREEIMKRLHLLNPIVKSILITKSVVTVPDVIMSEEKDIKKEDYEIIHSKETTKEKEKNEIEAEIRLFDTKDISLDKKEKDEEKMKKEEIDKETQKKQNKKQIEDILYQPIDPTVKIGDKLVIQRLPPQKPIKLRISPHYMTNRAKYIQKITHALGPYADKIQNADTDISCESRSTTEINDLLTHQEIVRDYLNLYTPYRGLLLYHGLGSGKTCSSIAIAEGMKTNKQVVLMTPASLKMNFFSELKKCGDDLYKKNQYWEFISIAGQPKNVAILSNALNIPVKYIKKKKGAWLVDISKTPNFSELSPEDQRNVDEQLNMMIRAKYIDINYNGLNVKKMRELTKDKSINPFDHKVVIIDEAHNFVSRIVNKLNKSTSLSYMLYDYLIDAIDVKIVLLTGTPIINYAHEISVLFNILRGNIKSWSLQLRTTTTKKVTRDTIMKMLDKGGLKTYDYIEYSGNTLTVTRNPFGFINYTPTLTTTIKEESIKDKKENLKGPLGIFREPKKGGTKNHKKQGHKKTKRKSADKIISISHIDYNVEEEEQELWKRHNEGMNNIYEGGGGEAASEYQEELNLYDQEERNQIKELSAIIKGGGIDDYQGVIYDDTGNISDTDFQRILIAILDKNGIKIVGDPQIVKYKCLPDNADDFNDLFISNGELTNIDVFQRRILGLTSYFRSAQEKLLPTFVKTRAGDNYHIVAVEMSNYQYSVYERIRKEERENEKKKRKVAKKNAKKNILGDEQEIASSYRIFSRAACNFVFPAIRERPMPAKKEDITEALFNAVTKNMRKNMDDYGSEDDEDEDENQKDSADIASYQKRIEDAMDFLKYDPIRQRSEEYLLPEGLASYSPKFLRILENLKDPTNEGLHLLYSQFRTIEGIGLLRLILIGNGFSEFKLEKTSSGSNDSEWRIADQDSLTNGHPKFVLYTGTETAEEKEIIRNIYNSAWEFVPPNIVGQLKKVAPNNFMGQLIKIFMITSSGAEGINLRNTRFVHIVEPYWNMVRMEQVIGRARRICSHKDLPEELRTVKVFIYLTILSEAQKTDDKNIELRILDVSKMDDNRVNTTDELLFEISQIKDRTNQQILKAIKETAIDCSLFNTNPDEPLICYSFGRIESNEYSTQPDIEKDKPKPVARETNKKIKWVPIEIIKNGKQYVLNKRTKEIYTIESYRNNVNKGTDLVLVGHLIRKERIINERKIIEEDILFDA